MDQLKHVRGPWFYNPEDDREGLTIRDSQNRKIAEVTDNRSFPLSTCEANAKLIAAAPEILEALLMAYNKLSVHGKSATLDIIISSIEKATK